MTAPAGREGGGRGLPSGCVVIVTGGRDYNDLPHVYRKLDVFHRRWPIALLRHGACRGTDSIARRWADSRGVATDPCRANWSKLGTAAGPIRNGQMLVKHPRPVAVIAFPGGDGTADMVRKARATSGVRVIEVKRYSPHRNYNTYHRVIPRRRNGDSFARD